MVTSGTWYHSSIKWDRIAVEHTGTQICSISMTFTTTQGVISELRSTLWYHESVRRQVASYQMSQKPQIRHQCNMMKSLFDTQKPVSNTTVNDIGLPCMSLAVTCNNCDKIWLRLWHNRAFPLLGGAPVRRAVRGGGGGDGTVGNLGHWHQDCMREFRCHNRMAQQSVMRAATHHIFFLAERAGDVLYLNRRKIISNTRH